MIMLLLFCLVVVDDDNNGDDGDAVDDTFLFLVDNYVDTST